MSASPVDDLIQQGQFAEAVRQTEERGRHQPLDSATLLMLYSLQVRLQRWAVADQTLDQLLAREPQLSNGLGAYRACAHAERTVAQRLVDPTIAGKLASLMMPPPFAILRARSNAAHAAGDRAEVAAVLAQIEQTRPRVSGTLRRTNGAQLAFVDIVDSDELTGPVLPCFNGPEALDLPYAQLRSVRFGRGQSSFDAMWIPVEVTMADGKVHQLRMPALYSGTGVAADPFTRTGQMTSWDRGRGYALGIGQRDLKLSGAGGEMWMVGALQIATIDLVPVATGGGGQNGSSGDGEKKKKKGFFARLFS